MDVLLPDSRCISIVRAAGALEERSQKEKLLYLVDKYLTHGENFQIQIKEEWKAGCIGFAGKSMLDRSQYRLRYGGCDRRRLV